MMTVVAYVLYALILALYIWALVDCVRTPAAQIRGLPKVGWLLLLLAVPILGTVLWRNWGKRSVSVVPVATVTTVPEEASR
jgi:hypothetical protein